MPTDMNIGGIIRTKASAAQRLHEPGAGGCTEYSKAHGRGEQAGLFAANAIVASGSRFRLSSLWLEQ